MYGSLESPASAERYSTVGRDVAYISTVSRTPAAARQYLRLGPRSTEPLRRFTATTLLCASSRSSRRKYEAKFASNASPVSRIRTLPMRSRRPNAMWCAKLSAEMVVFVPSQCAKTPPPPCNVFCPAASIIS